MGKREEIRGFVFKEENVGHGSDKPESKRGLC